VENTSGILARNNFISLKVFALRRERRLKVLIYIIRNGMNFSSEASIICIQIAFSDPTFEL